MINKKTAYTLAFCAAMTAQSSALTLLSNLSEPMKAANQIESMLWAAQGFNTDANSYVLTDIQALVGDETGAVTPFAELRSADGSGNMDTSAAGLLATFTVPSMAGPRSARVFTPNSTVVLAPSTKYYFLLGNFAMDTFDWSYALGNTWTGPGSFDQYEYSFDGGVTWGTFGTDDPFHMEVNAEPVPEPMTGLVLLGGMGFMRLLRRRRQAVG